MKETKYGYLLENTGRNFKTHGVDGLSIQYADSLGVGCDSFVSPNNDPDLEFSSVEKKEIAMFAIREWMEYGNIDNGDLIINLIRQVDGFLERRELYDAVSSEICMYCFSDRPCYCTRDD